MSNGYVNGKDYRRTRKVERKKTKDARKRNLSNYEHILQEEVFAVPAHDIENYLEAHPCIVRKYDNYEEPDSIESYDIDQDEFDPISEYGEDPYFDDGDFSEPDDTRDSIFFTTDKTKTSRRSIGNAVDRCDIVFSIDQAGHWEVASPQLGKLRLFEPSEEKSYEGNLILNFIEKRYKILLKIAEYLSRLMEQKKLIPTETNKKNFFLNFPEFTAVEIITEIKKKNGDDIHKSTLSRLNNAVFHMPIIGDIRLGDILDITKNAETYAKVIRLIDKEDKKNPLKDTEIAEKVGLTDRQVKNIRAELGIPNIYQRRIKGESP